MTDEVADEVKDKVADGGVMGVGEGISKVCFVFKTHGATNEMTPIRVVDTFNHLIPTIGKETMSHTALVSNPPP